MTPETPDLKDVEDPRRSFRLMTRRMTSFVTSICVQVGNHEKLPRYVNGKYFTICHDFSQLLGALRHFSKPIQLIIQLHPTGQGPRHGPCWFPLTPGATTATTATATPVSKILHWTPRHVAIDRRWHRTAPVVGCDVGIGCERYSVSREAVSEQWLKSTKKAID